MAFDAGLTAYYEPEARGNDRTKQVDLRVRLRQRFGEVLRGESRTRIVDVGAGPGLDVAGFKPRASLWLLSTLPRTSTFNAAAGADLPEASGPCVRRARRAGMGIGRLGPEFCGRDHAVRR